MYRTSLICETGQENHPVLHHLEGSLTSPRLRCAWPKPLEKFSQSMLAIDKLTAIALAKAGAR